MWPKYLGVKSLLTLEGLNGIGMCWFGLELVVLLMVEAGVKCRHGTEEFFFQITSIHVYQNRSRSRTYKNPNNCCRIVIWCYRNRFVSIGALGMYWSSPSPDKLSS